MIGAMSEIYTSDFKEQPYWWEEAAPAQSGTMPLPAETDIAVVGAGYAGLSAALELARNNLRATVLERHGFGWGASTRNGGAVSSGISIGRGLSGDRNRSDEALRGAADAFTHLDAIVARENIACHWEQRGRFVGAYTSKHYDNLARMVDVLNRETGARAVMLPRARQRQEIASDYYRGGMVIERSGKLHPALYYRGLLDAARRAGVMLCAHTAVHRIERHPGGFALHTSAGRLNSREIAICTNGYTDDIAPKLRRRIIPVASHIIATEPLPSDIASRLLPNGRTISDTKRVLCYYRMSPDGQRLIFGGRARFTAVAATKSVPILHRFMVDRFPQLSKVKITHAWTGNVAFTFDFLPHMGVMDGMHYCIGCNGSGVAMMSYLGHSIGRKIVSGSNRMNAFDGHDFPVRAGYDGHPWFLPIVGAYYRARDRIDRWLG
jgi:glycine/D-amino acid oxidase-like deaminating enzyme